MPATAKANTRDDDAVFAALKHILEPYAKKLRVLHDTPDNYYLETMEPVYKGRPMMMAAVRRGKNYVSYHLMTIYAHPGQASKISPELKKRMQGKACFNFTTVDEKLFAELAKLTAEGAKIFGTKGITPGKGTCD